MQTDIKAKEQILKMFNEALNESNSIEIASNPNENVKKSLKEDSEGNKPTDAQAKSHLDEIVQVSTKFDFDSSKKSHDWIDDNGRNDWEYFKTYIQEKNKTIWKATLDIANSANGKKVLYDVDKFEMVEAPVKSGLASTNNSISNSADNVKNSLKEDSLGNKLSDEQVEYFKDSNGSLKSLKEEQLEVIQNSNPMLDDIHTGIRSVDDIKTFEEAIKGYEDGVTPDFSKYQINKALKNGVVTVYSSHPIENGAFVTPSKMMAEDYAGGGDVIPPSERFSDSEDIRYARKEIENFNARVYNQVRLPAKEYYAVNSAIMQQDLNNTTPHFALNSVIYGDKYYTYYYDVNDNPIIVSVADITEIERNDYEFDQDTSGLFESLKNDGYGFGNSPNGNQLFENSQATNRNDKLADGLLQEQNKSGEGRYTQNDSYPYRRKEHQLEVIQTQIQYLMK